MHSAVQVFHGFSVPRCIQHKMGVALSYSSLVAEGVLDETPKEREREIGWRERESERERGWREGERFEDSYDIIPITSHYYSNYSLCVFSIISIYIYYSVRSSLDGM